MSASISAQVHAAAMYAQQAADLAEARKRHTQPTLVGYCADEPGRMRAYYDDGTSHEA